MLCDTEPTAQVVVYLYIYINDRSAARGGAGCFLSFVTGITHPFYVLCGVEIDIKSTI